MKNFTDVLDGVVLAYNPFPVKANVLVFLLGVPFCHVWLKYGEALTGAMNVVPKSEDLAGLGSFSDLGISSHVRLEKKDICAGTPIIIANFSDNDLTVKKFQDGGTIVLKPHEGLTDKNVIINTQKQLFTFQYTASRSCTADEVTFINQTKLVRTLIAAALTSNAFCDYFGVDELTPIDRPEEPAPEPKPLPFTPPIGTFMNFDRDPNAINAANANALMQGLPLPIPGGFTPQGQMLGLAPMPTNCMVPKSVAEMSTPGIPTHIPLNPGNPGQGFCQTSYFPGLIWLDERSHDLLSGIKHMDTVQLLERFKRYPINPIPMLLSWIERDRILGIRDNRLAIYTKDGSNLFTLEDVKHYTRHLSYNTYTAIDFEALDCQLRIQFHEPHMISKAYETIIKLSALSFPELFMTVIQKPSSIVQFIPLK